MSSRQTRLDVGGYPVWSPCDSTLGVAFVGRGARQSRRKVLTATTRIDRSVAWLRQVHGDCALEARDGNAGEADALWTTRRTLALAISTADCVPVVLLGSDRVAAVHAGWRGIVAGVVGRAVDTFGQAAQAPTAWIGPAIGACCYEVGPDVADQVLAACDDPAVSQSPTEASRPHLDLARAVKAQLRGCGLTAVETVAACTYCDPQLHSFRRDGPAAGRNLTFAWLPNG